MTEYDLNIKIRDDGVYILETEKYIFHLDEKTHVEKIGKLINENEHYEKMQKESLELIREQRKTVEGLTDENEQLKQQLAHHTRMHEWFRNEAYLLQNKLDNREDEIRRLKGDVE